MKKISLLCITILVAVASSSQAKPATITWLGASGSYYGNQATCVSADGSVVAGYDYDSQTAFIYANNTQTMLGPRIANGMSADGSTVVGYNSSYTATRWRNGQAESLGKLDPLGVNSVAYAASDNGDVIVGSGGSLLYHAGEAFRWENGVMAGLGGLIDPHNPFNPYSMATDVSNDGSIIVGHSGSWNYGKEAFRWENDTMTGLSYLSGSIPDYPTRSEATAISGNGQVIVGWSSSSIGNQPFRWENGVMTGLGHLHSNSVVPTIATGVSYDGSIVVGTEYGGEPYRNPFIWDAQHGMRNLQDVLRNEYNLDLGQYRLSEVLGISDDGKTIVGWGYGPQAGENAFVVQIPEPATILILGLGGIFLRGRKELK